MLILQIEASELWSEKEQQFINIKPLEIRMEHSLVSISKWESVWHKSFLSTKDKTNEEVLDYMRHMTITQHVNPAIYHNLSQENTKKILDYINDPMTATTFPDGSGKNSRETITAEIIYYWMISFNIPFECQKWHINRLLTLIRVCNAKQQKPKKMTRAEALQKQRALNAERRRQLGTSG